MKLRYEDTDESVANVLAAMRSSYFPNLRNAKIKTLFDTKKRKRGGGLVLASIVLPNDLIRHFTVDEAAEAGSMDGYDYIVILDKACWTNIDVKDRERIIRHELRHAYFDIESEKSPYRLIDHSIKDFYEEVEINADDPRWQQRVLRLTLNIREQEKDQKSESGEKRGRGRPRKARGFGE